jgi:hypothetical protein
MGVVLAQTLRAFDLLIARGEFELFVETLVFNFLLSLAIVNTSFFPIQCLYIVYDVLTLLVELVQAFNLSLIFPFSSRIFS